MYHYRESGLNNVWLANGFRFQKTPYGETVTIDDIPGLHQVIGTCICERSPKLTGAEFRFLRRELELTQEALAPLLGVSAQQIALYERNRPTAMADRLMRAYFREHVSGNANLRQLISTLVARDKTRHQQRKLTFRSNDGWHPGPKASVG